MFAATEGNIKTVQELLTKENIDITAKNIWIVNFSIFNFFVSHYLKFAIFNGISNKNIFSTAIDIARARNHPEIFDILTKKLKQDLS